MIIELGSFGKAGKQLQINQSGLPPNPLHCKEFKDIILAGHKQFEEIFN